MEIHGEVQLTIGKKLLELSKDYPQTLAGYTQFWRAAQEIKGDMNRKRAKTLMKRVEKIEKRMERSKGGSFGSMRRGYNQIMQAWVEGSANKGMRDAGAGRKWHFTKHTTYLKAWHQKERSRGHAIDRTDLKDEWLDQLEMDIKLMDASANKFSEKEQKLYDAMKQKQKTLMHGKEKAVEKAVNAMCAKIGARMLVPSRASDLSTKEEHVRAELTWQQIDERIWLAGCANMEELRNWLADPQKFMEGREDTWLVFSDQIPLWVKIGMLKVLYAEYEILSQKDSKDSKKVRKERQKKILATRGKDSQKLEQDEAADDFDEDMQDDAADEVEQKDPAAAPAKNQGMGQKRGGDAAGEKCRVTLEARQAVSGYFSGDPTKIKGHILPSVLVLKGKYASLDNIDDNHRFKQTVEFYIGEKKITHKKGQKTRLMEGIVELRKRMPEIFEGLVVFGQPAAWMDEIIQSWCCQDLGDRIDQCVHQRDLFAAALTDTNKKIMSILGQIPSWIAAKMTAVQQLTDTDFAFPMKAAVKKIKTEMAREMRNRARLTGESERFKCGNEEIIRIAQGAHKEMVRMNAEQDLVLKGLRRNGMLQYRPNVVEGRLEDCDLDERFADMPVGSHRLKDEWLQNRKDWLDGLGRPTPADWNRSEHAKEMADLAEHDYCRAEKAGQKEYTERIGGQDIKVPIIDVECDDQSLFDDKAALESLHPKLRRELGKHMAGKRTEKEKNARAAQKKIEREKVQFAIAHMKEDWKEWCSESLIKQSRKELARSIVPRVEKKRSTNKKSGGHTQSAEGKAKRSAKKAVINSKDGYGQKHKPAMRISTGESAEGGFIIRGW